MHPHDLLQQLSKANDLLATAAPSLTLDILPPQCSKPALASVARMLARKHLSSNPGKSVQVTVEELDALMEGWYL